MLEEIYDGEVLLALILRSNFSREGIHFFTPKEFSQQLGYMKRPKGYLIQPHIHNHINRDVSLTQEVLFVKQGKIKMQIYDLQKKPLQELILETGDCVLLAAGGHGFEMLEESELIEVKTGPHIGDEDKTRF
jgi:mannose-6-phosphate isomerase-like protein (cupin superfamily)